MAHAAGREAEEKTQDRGRGVSADGAQRLSGSPAHSVSCSTLLFSMLGLKTILLPQELEELVKDKEKDLEKAEERGNALIRDEKAAAFPVVKETLKGLNQSWAHLDHMVCVLNPFFVHSMFTVL